MRTPCTFRTGLTLSLLMLSIFGTLKETVFGTRRSSTETPDIILITIDTLRADHLGCYGYRRASTPVIDNLAKEGVRYADATAQVPLTLPSHYTILSGTFPFHHGVRDNSHGMADGSPLVSEFLKQRGYRTAAFVSSYVLDTRFGLNRGFDFYYDDFDVSVLDSPDSSSLRRTAGEVIQRVTKWLLASPAPFFIWIHFYDLHTPYSPPEPFKSRFSDSPYDAEIAYVDSSLGALVNFLKAQQWLQDTDIILTSDHGEGLGDHDEPGHGFFVYQSTIQVPLIVRTRRIRKEEIIGRPVQSVDIAPTLLRLAGITPSTRMDGSVLREVFDAPGRSLDYRSTNESDRWIYFESLYPERDFGWSALRGIRASQFKYIDAPRPELYDLRRDPGERENLFQTRPAVAEQLKDQLNSALVHYGSTPHHAVKASALDTVALLSALGYVAGSSKVVGPAEQNRKDPKDELNVFLRISEALVLSNSGKAEFATEILESIVRQAPEVLSARLILGKQYETMEQLPKAADQYAHVLAAQPDNALAAFDLGGVLAKEGKLDEAVSWYRRTLEADPTFTPIHTALGIVYRSQRHWPEAIQEFQAALKFGPNYTALYNISAIYLILGQTDQALADARLAANLQPRHWEIYNLLGSIYMGKAKNSYAEHCFRRALELNPQSDEALINLAQLLIRMGDAAGARNALLKAIKINPEQQLARRLFNQLSGQ